MRRVICNTLAIIVGEPSVEVDAHRNHACDLFFLDTPWDQHHKVFVEDLFNGDIRGADRIEHYVRPSHVVKPPRVILRFICIFGINWVLPRQHFQVLRREKWTSVEATTAEIDLFSIVHNLLSVGFIKALDLVDNSLGGICCFYFVDLCSKCSFRCLSQIYIRHVTYKTELYECTQGNLNWINVWPTKTNQIIKSFMPVATESITYQDNDIGFDINHCRLDKCGIRILSKTFVAAIATWRNPKLFLMLSRVKLWGGGYVWRIVVDHGWESQSSWHWNTIHLVALLFRHQQ